MSEIIPEDIREQADKVWARIVWFTPEGSDAADRIARAILADRERQWQPIETAPRGVAIWGCDPSRGYEAKVINFDCEWICISFNGFCMDVGFYPTIWQPLPQLPPTTDTREAIEP